MASILNVKELCIFDRSSVAVTVTFPSSVLYTFFVPVLPQFGQGATLSGSKEAPQAVHSAVVSLSILLASSIFIAGIQLTKGNPLLPLAHGAAELDDDLPFFLPLNAELTDAHHCMSLKSIKMI